MSAYLPKCVPQAILELSEKGVLDELEEKWMKPKVCPDDSDLKTGNTAPQLNIMSFRGLYYMLFVFAALSLLWTAVEHVGLAVMSRSAPPYAADSSSCIQYFQSFLRGCTWLHALKIPFGRKATSKPCAGIGGMYTQSCPGNTSQALIRHPAYVLICSRTHRGIATAPLLRAGLDFGVDFSVAEAFQRVCRNKTMREKAENISEFLTSDGSHLFKEGEKGRRALQEPRGVMYMRRTMSKDGGSLSPTSRVGHDHRTCCAKVLSVMVYEDHLGTVHSIRRQKGNEDFTAL